jgi:hypothetical protein
MLDDVLKWTIEVFYCYSKIQRPRRISFEIAFLQKFILGHNILLIDF